jgi:hypothetical protein
MQAYSQSGAGQADNTDNIYVILRVFNLGKDSVSLKALVDPEGMRGRGELGFEAGRGGFGRRPGEGGILFDSNIVYILLSVSYWERASPESAVEVYCVWQCGQRSISRPV